MANKVEIVLAGDGSGLKVVIDGAVSSFDKLGRSASAAEIGRAHV